MENIYEKKNEKTAVIISISSDIGYALAQRYSELGYKIIGTYRSTKSLEKLKQIPNCYLFYCDLNNKKSIDEFIENFRKLKLYWNLLICCACEILPYELFFKCNFEEWEESVHINIIEQLRILHKLYLFRDKEKIVNVVFFSGAGTNCGVLSFSSSVASKIMLMKMCELLDLENNDMKFFIIGPGWVKTKGQTKMMDNLDKNNPKYIEVDEFMKSNRGTSMDNIFECIRWLEKQNKDIVGGRNFAVANDKWSGEREDELINELKSDKDMYKLRRYKNDFLIGRSNQ